MEEDRHFLIFEVDSFHFCAPVDTVLGIIMPPPVTTMPMAPFHVAGSFLFRGNAALALDMRRQLGLPEFIDGAGVFIVAQLESGLVGFRADVVADIVPVSRLESCPVAFPKIYRFFKQFVLLDEQIVLQTDFEMLFAAEACAGTLTGLLEIVAPSLAQQPEDSHEQQEREQIGQGGGEAGGQEGAESGSAEVEGPGEPQPAAEIEPASESAVPPQHESALEKQESPAPRRPPSKPASQPRSHVVSPSAATPLGVAQTTVRAGSRRQHQTRQPVGSTRASTGPEKLRGQAAPQSPSSSAGGRLPSWPAPASKASRPATARSFSESPSPSSRDRQDVPSRSFRGGPILVAVILLLCLAAIFWWPAEEAPVSSKSGLEKVGRESAGPAPGKQEYGLAARVKPPVASRPQEERVADLQVSAKEALVDQPRLAQEERPTEVVRVETSDFTLTIERPAPQDQEQETSALLPVVEEETTVTGEMITHIVVKNDTLWDIAEKYLGNPIKYEELARLSRIQDPHWIYPGDIIRIVKRNNGDQ